MDNDALVRTLSARVASLEELVKADRELLERQRQELARLYAEQIIAQAADGTGPLPAVPPRRHKRDRSHLRVVKGAVIAAAIAGLWHLLWGTTARRVVTVALGGALAGATVLTPAIRSAASPPQPHTPSPRGQAPSVVAPGSPPPRHHRARATAGSRPGHSAPSPAPSPVVSPSPSPIVTPLPVPTPTVPVPLPTQSLTGCIKHPHPGCPTPPASLPSLPPLLDGKVVSAADWLKRKTHRLRLLPAAA